MVGYLESLTRRHRISKRWLRRYCFKTTSRWNAQQHSAVDYFLVYSITQLIAVANQDLFRF